jgi:NAD(P)-dependent dehydrogenase (short-subunit alcohol dehydrogenase family)
MSKTILITGANSGFGRDTAETQAKVVEALGLSYLEKIA